MRRRHQKRHGSSPRMRGTGFQRQDLEQRRRFIPAHAGNGQTGNSISHSACGSSPRMRGTDMILNFPIKQRRFIPAHAGNGWTRFPLPLRRSVHPRACGERQNQGRHTGADAGSSPRMRGTVWRCVWHDPVPRFIPAHAGNGLEHSRTKLALTVHPRACGERAD